MKVKNHRNLLNAIVALVLLVVCIYALISKGFQIKYLIASVISAGLLVVNLFWTERNKGTEEMIMGQTDERDLYNAMKSSQATLRITNDICLVSALFFILIYAITKTEIYLNIGITLVVVIIVMFAGLLLSNRYYEKYN